jgi:predicted  nucleic acid-binding Zn-ribbon protein
MLANLQSGKDKIHNNAQVIFNGNDVAIQDLRDLQVLLEPLNEDLKTTQWMVYDINSNLNYLDSDLMDASSKLKTLNTRLKQLGNSMSGTSLSNLEIEELKPSAKDAIDSLEDVVSDISKATNNAAKKSNRNRIKASASEIVTDAALDNASDYKDYTEL